ncbi:MAG: hypothetical protein R3E10_17530 [Gemmatimonadota bacterium]
MRIVTLILACAASATFAGPLYSQQNTRPAVPEDKRAVQLPRQQLAGPRFGFTVFTGDVADQRQEAGYESLMTQFGWQFETQIVSLESANQALMEWIFLVGGLEQNETNLSLAWITGYRVEGGLEFGVGPNFSVNPKHNSSTTSIQVAAGATLPFGEMYVPVNFSVGVARGGPRMTALLGWIVG